MKRPWPISAVADVVRSTEWYMKLLDAQQNHPGSTVFNQIQDDDGAILLCLHRWGPSGPRDDHEWPSLADPGKGTAVAHQDAGPRHPALYHSWRSAVLGCQRVQTVRRNLDPIHRDSGCCLDRVTDSRTGGKLVHSSPWISASSTARLEGRPPRKQRVSLLSSEIHWGLRSSSKRVGSDNSRSSSTDGQSFLEKVD